jgi:2-polyprenyl-3-methyl-5-hydroxy-6-metoxy-1,4-benzoquinol methylase
MGFSSQALDGPDTRPGPPIAWEETDCLLCGGRRWVLLAEGPDATPGGTGLWFAVVRCQDCGLCFTNPRPTPASMGYFYPPNYRPHYCDPCPARNQQGALSLLSGLRSALHGAGWPHKARQNLPWQGQGRLLDFGCGGGSYLERMHRRGWQVTGVDVSLSAIQRIRSELGLDALAGTLPHPELEPASFDVITMWHSLEHVHEPLTVLREAHRLLVPGGKLLVAVPNIDSLPFRWFGSAWYGLDLPRHLTHFTPATLRQMLQEAGFRIGPVRMVRHSHWLRWSARLAHRMRHGPSWLRWLRVKPLSRLTAWCNCLRRQSDCVLVTAGK